MRISNEAIEAALTEVPGDAFRLIDKADVRAMLEAAAPHMKFDAHTAKPNNWV